MTVMQVVDDADILHALGLQGLHHRKEVLGFAEPIPVVIQTHLAPLCGASVADRLEPCHFGGDAGLLIRRVFHRDGTAIAHHPQLWVHVMLTEKCQGLLALVIQDRREPPTRERDATFL